MCEITKSNFSNAFPYIVKDIHRADFIAVDAEFTGLKYSEKQKPSLFDNGEDRYAKLRNSVSKFTLSQIGLAMFIKEEKTNTFWVYTYNIYLFPNSFGDIDVRFLVQASSFDFLCRHNFDFNKFVYGGVPFLNQEQEAEIMSNIIGHQNSVGVDRNVDERCLQEYCSLVSEWLMTADEGATMDVPFEQDGLSCQMLLLELRNRFTDAWATQQDDGQIVVQKMAKQQREEIALSTKQEEEDRVMKQLLGFTGIFRELVRSNKPLVGHNNLTDLMFMYDKFYKSLPTKYSHFKEELHKLFPQIYDTKHMSACIRKSFRETGVFESTNLADLHRALETEKGRFLVLYQPNIKHAEGCDRYVDVHFPHEAGYDAFMCGKVFIKIAHILAMREKAAQQQRHLTFPEQIAAVRQYKNHVNVIRGSINYVNIAGPDPVSQRPQWLYVRSRKAQESLNPLQLAQLFSAYGSVDIRMQGSNQALVAIGNYGTSRDILRRFWKHDSVHVVKYRMWRHSPVIRKIMWTGVLLSGGMMLWALLGGNGDKRV